MPAPPVSTGPPGPPRPSSDHADLKLGEGVRPVLEAMQSASPNRFRGVRHSVGWDESPELANRDIQGALSTEGYRAGAKALAGMGLILENSLYFHQLTELAEFARAVPELTIVLNHIGGLVRIGPYANRDDEVIPAWRQGVEEAARCPNIVMKLGGVGQLRYGFYWHDRETPIGSEELAGALGPLMEHCIQRFGPDRCMFESNFPGGQTLLFLQRAVQRLQTAIPGLLGFGAGRHVPRHRRPGLQHQHLAQGNRVIRFGCPFSFIPVETGIRGGRPRRRRLAPRISGFRPLPSPGQALRRNDGTSLRRGGTIPNAIALTSLPHLPRTR